MTTSKTVIKLHAFVPASINKPDFGLLLTKSKTLYSDWEIPKGETVSFCLSILINAMKLFRLVQIYFEMFGIHPPRCTQGHSINATILLIVVLFVSSIISTMSFCLFKSKTMREYGDSFYPSVTVLTILVSYGVIISNVSNIFKLINAFEAFVLEREYSIF